MQNGEHLYTIDDVSKIFQCAKSTIWRWVSTGTIPKPIKIGGTTRWVPSAMSDAIEAAQQGRADKPPQENKPRKLRRVKAS